MIKFNQLVIVANGDCQIDDGHTLKEGVVVCQKKFNPIPAMYVGDLLALKYEDLGKWIHNDGMSPMKYLFDVEIDRSEDVVDLKNGLIKFKRGTLSNKRTIWDNYEICLNAVRGKGMAFEFVKCEKTFQLHLEAARNHGASIACMHDTIGNFTPEQRHAIYMAAAVSHGQCLRLIPDEEKTDEMCLIAAIENPFSLEHIPERLQTELICTICVMKYGYVLYYVKHQTENICVEAVKSYIHAINFCNVRTKRVLDAHREAHGDS